MTNIAVYVGAGKDIKPVLLFKNIVTFIYIDSQPLTEFGNSELFPGYERPEFPHKIYKSMTKIGFIKKNDFDENLHEYFNTKTGQTLKYYMNCCFPNNLSKILLNDIKTANILICCGHDPSSNLIALMKPGPKTFIGDNRTCYTIEGDEHYFTVVRALTDEPHLMENYIRFDMPKDYPYWKDNYTKESHTNKFAITYYKSIEDLFNTRVKGSL